MENRITGVISVWLLAASVVVTMLLWMFAFWDMPESSPEWLARAQAVCFGRTESGLPDTSGWIVLILSPLLLMSSLYITYADELALSIPKVLSSRGGVCMLAILFAALIAQGNWVAAQINQGLNSVAPIETATGTLPTNYPRTSVHAPDFTLINQRGEKVSIASFRGRPIILSFIFAHCQTVCPVLVKTVQAAHSLTMDVDPVVLLVTLDPLRDTPASLPTLARKWNLAEQEFVLSAQPQEVDEVIKSFNIPTSRDEKNGDIVHPALVYVIDRNGNLSYSFNNPSPEWIQEAIKRL